MEFQRKKRKIINNNWELTSYWHKAFAWLLHTVKDLLDIVLNQRIDGYRRYLLYTEETKDECDYLRLDGQLLLALCISMGKSY